MDTTGGEFYNSRHPNNQTDSLAKVTGPLFFPRSEVPAQGLSSAGDSFALRTISVSRAIAESRAEGYIVAAVSKLPKKKRGKLL